MRHGRSVPAATLPPEKWVLDPAGHAEIDELGRSGRIPLGADWFTSPETKALETARRLTDLPVAVVDDLSEHRRGVHWFDSPEQFRAAVRRAFDVPHEPAVPTWEPLALTQERVVVAVRRILSERAGDVVLVGHGTAWTMLVAALTGRPADLDAWERLRMPDLWVLDT